MLSTDSLTGALVSGILILVFGQIIQKSFLEPIQDLRLLIGEIGHSLVYHTRDISMALAPMYADSVRAAESSEEPYRRINIEIYEGLIRGTVAKSNEARDTLRQQASRLMGKAHVVPWYKLFALVGIVPNQHDLIAASQGLIGLSNSGESLDTEKIKEIARLLKIEIVTERFGAK